MLAILTLLACTAAGPAAPADDTAPTTETPTDTATPPPADDRLVTDGIWRMDGVDAALPPADLAPLGTIAADAEIVALGESVHQVDTYHLARERIIPFLVADLGYRAVALEAPVIPVEATRAWVERGEGSLDDAVAGLYFGVWTSVSFSRTLTWLREWNVAHPDDPVRFFGIDMQGFQYDFPYVREVLDAVDPDAAPDLLAGVAGCVGGTFESPADYTAASWEYALLTGEADYPEAQYDACLQGLDALDAWFAGAADAVASTFDADVRTLTGVALRSGRQMQTELYFPLSNKAGWDARDLGMADNFEDLREARAPGEPTILVMHNAHIQRAGELLDPYVYPVGWKNTGSWLADRRGDAYAPLLQFGWKVTYAYGTTSYSNRAGSGTLEADLKDLGEEMLFVDMDLASAAGTVTAASIEFGNPSPGTGVPAVHARAALYFKETEAMESYY